MCCNCGGGIGCCELLLGPSNRSRCCSIKSLRHISKVWAWAAGGCCWDMPCISLRSVSMRKDCGAGAARLACDRNSLTKSSEGPAARGPLYYMRRRRRPWKYLKSIDCRDQSSLCLSTTTTTCSEKDKCVSSYPGITAAPANPSSFRALSRVSWAPIRIS